MYDVLIIGGGLAGLVSAIELGRAGHKTLLIEKKAYPHHKVCGEYISNEVLGYLNSLDFDPFSLGAKKLNRFQLSAVSGFTANLDLPLGGFGLSRYAFDEALYKIALRHGVEFIFNDSAENVARHNNLYRLSTLKGKTFDTQLVIGAFGKRSSIDKQLNRNFIKKRSSYIGVKCHYKGDFPDDLVSLHNFRGGYCGLSMIENGHINVCYLSHEQNLKKYGNIRSMELELLSENPMLKKVFNEWEPQFSAPLSISQIYFHEKELIKNDIFMAGDAAGLIYPLCGNGMAMAIHAAKVLSGLVLEHFRGEIDKEFLAAQYKKIWKNNFSTRLYLGGVLQHFFGNVWVSGTAVRLLKTFPGIGRQLIRKTHGAEI
jgi:menaquinone-9 beta-reductase